MISELMLESMLLNSKYRSYNKIAIMFVSMRRNVGVVSLEACDGRIEGCEPSKFCT